jgi:hypothetical protein
MVQDSDSGPGVDQVDYTNGSWNVAGSVHFNTGETTTASYAVRFYGSQLLVRGGWNTDHRIAAFSICDAAGNYCTPEDLVDMYASKLGIDQPAWQSPVVPLDVYVVNVRATHSKNAGSSGYIVDFDAARVYEQRWASTDGFIGRFDTLPAPCAARYRARTWTAPYEGTVAVRGWIVGRQPSGDGAHARITLNGSLIWPSTAGSQAIAARGSCGRRDTAR